LLSRVILEDETGSQTVDKAHLYPPDEEPSDVWDAITRIVGFIDAAGGWEGGPLVTDYGGYVALEAEIEATQRDACAAGLTEKRNLGPFVSDPGTLALAEQFGLGVCELLVGQHARLMHLCQLVELPHHVVAGASRCSNVGSGSSSRSCSLLGLHLCHVLPHLLHLGFLLGVSHGVGHGLILIGRSLILSSLRVSLGLSSLRVRTLLGALAGHVMYSATDDGHLGDLTDHATSSSSSWHLLVPPTPL